MKINKLMLALAVAATTIAACNKQETTPVVNDNMGNKSIVLNIANVLPGTKTPGTSIADQTQVTLNDYQIFFVDGNGTFYAPKDVTSAAEAETFFEVEPNKPLTHQFHFLDNNVTRVIVVGNMGKDFAPANETALWAALANVAVENQQDEDALILYGSDSNLTADAPNHDNFEDQHPTPVYKAVVNLMPAVARFEVTGYEYAQTTVAEGETAPAREYASVVMNSQSLIGYYDAASFKSTSETDWTVTPGTMSKPVVTYTWDNVYQDYFSKLTDTDKGAWYYDATAYTLNADNSYVAAAAPSETQDCYAYHVYPAAVPSFIFQITATDANGIVTPMYLQTKGFTGLTEIAAGNVYQMNVRFDDSVLKAAEKCIDVEITVHDWVVTVVIPQF